MALCDPGRDPNGCWERDCPCGADGCHETWKNNLTGEVLHTKCYGVKFSPCNSLKCEEGENAGGTFEVGFRIVDPNDPNYGTGAAAGRNYRCMEVSDIWREKMCCGERGWNPGFGFGGGGGPCNEDPDTPDNPGDGDDGGGSQKPIVPITPVPDQPLPGGDQPGEPPASPDGGDGNNNPQYPVCNGVCVFKWVLNQYPAPGDPFAYHWAISHHTAGCGAYYTDPMGAKWECLCASQKKGHTETVFAGSTTPIYIQSGVQATWFEQPCTWQLQSPATTFPGAPPLKPALDPDAPETFPGKEAEERATDEPQPVPETQGEPCASQCLYAWGWSRTPQDGNGNFRAGIGQYSLYLDCNGQGDGGVRIGGGKQTNCVCDPDNAVAKAVLQGNQSWPLGQNGRAAGQAGWRQTGLGGDPKRFLSVACVPSKAQSVRTGLQSSYNSVKELTDEIYASYKNVRQAESSASSTQYAPLRWQGKITDETLDGIQHVIFHDLESSQIAEANTYGDNYVNDSTVGRASSGPVVEDVRVQKVAGASENTRLITVNLVDRATRMSDGSSNPELRDGEPGCGSRQAIYNWTGNGYTLSEGCGGNNCEPNEIPTSYSVDNPSIRCKKKNSNSGIEGWPVLSMPSAPATAIRQLNNPAIASSGHQVKILGPDGWAIASGSSPTGAGAASTWPKKFSEIIPRGVEVLTIVNQDTYPVASSTPMFSKTPSETGDITIQEDGSIARVHPSFYAGAVLTSKMVTPPNKGTVGGAITVPSGVDSSSTSTTSTSTGTTGSTGSTGSTGTTGSSGSSGSGY